MQGHALLVKDIPVETRGSESRCWRICLLEPTRTKASFECAQLVSMARGRKSKISFRQAFIPERKARSTKINKAQQGLRAATGCQAAEKVSEDVRVKSEVDRQMVPKLW